jgi:LytS/YehU family sensor histidine kinase
VRHGIEPGEEGGRIDVSVALRDGRCVARVVDTGVGLERGTGGTGTGLANLRERLRLVFGDAQVRLAANTPHGAVAEIEFPAREGAA